MKISELKCWRAWKHSVLAHYSLHINVVKKWLEIKFLKWIFQNADKISFPAPYQLISNIIFKFKISTIRLSEQYSIEFARKSNNEGNNLYSVNYGYMFCKAECIIKISHLRKLYGSYTSDVLLNIQFCKHKYSGFESDKNSNIFVWTSAAALNGSQFTGIFD